MEVALEDVRRGCTRVLAVTGEAGIGKTALLAAVAVRARATRVPMLVLEGRAAEHERDVPFAVAVDALDSHVAGLHPRRVAALGADLGAVLPSAADPSDASPPTDGDPAERVRRHRALRGLLELLGRERPFVLLLDDLHWSDDASLELVLHMLRRPPAEPHLLVFALRPVAPMPRLLDAARGAPGFEQLALAPLGDEEALGLLAGVSEPTVRARLAREARGNPLYLRELARAAGRPGDELPATLVAAVGAELAALAPRARRLLDGAAVAGDPFDPELAAAAAGVEPDAGALDALVAAGLVSASAGVAAREFAFRHPLVRRAIYDAVPPAWRLAAHERTAAVLEQRRAAPAARAYHVARFARPADDHAIALLAEVGVSGVRHRARDVRALLPGRPRAGTGHGRRPTREPARADGTGARCDGAARREPHGARRAARAARDQSRPRSGSRS